jgi:predicted N-acetyltransferase YhbS
MPVDFLYAISGGTSMIEIRKEEPRDEAAVRHVNQAAFENRPEAAVVDELHLHWACSSCDRVTDAHS